MGTGKCQAGKWAHGWARLGGAHGGAWQGCGQLETFPAALTGAGADSPGGPTWGPGPWAGGGNPGGRAGAATPANALRALAASSYDIVSELNTPETTDLPPAAHTGNMGPTGSIFEAVMVPALEETQNPS